MNGKEVLPAGRKDGFVNEVGFGGPPAIHGGGSGSGTGGHRRDREPLISDLAEKLGGGMENAAIDPWIPRSARRFFFSIEFGRLHYELIVT
jgi:hypothetical protein